LERRCTVNINRILQAERDRQAREAAVEAVISTVTALPEVDRRTVLARLILSEQEREPAAVPTKGGLPHTVLPPAPRRERRERREPTIPALILSILAASDEPLTVQGILARIHEVRPTVSHHSVKQAVVNLKAANRIVQVATGPNHGGVYALASDESGGPQ
jgi:hypothetical protein